MLSFYASFQCTHTLDALHSSSNLSPWDNFMGRCLFLSLFVCARPLCVRELSRVHCPKVQRESPLSQKSSPPRAVVVVSWKKRHQKVISMRAAVPQMEMKKSPKVTKKAEKHLLIVKSECNTCKYARKFSVICDFFVTWRISYTRWWRRHTQSEVELA